MFASVDGAMPGYMAPEPHILAPRHVFPPSILGCHLTNTTLRLSGRYSSAESLTRMDGGYPECMAKIKSTLR